MSMGEMPEKGPSMATLDEILREAHKPMVVEMLLAGNPFYERLLHTNNMPKMTLIPWAKKLDDWMAQTRSRVRWMRRDLEDWWTYRPTFLGGEGLSDYFND